MTHEFAQSPEHLDPASLNPGIAEVTLDCQDRIVIPQDSPALLDRETTLRELGLDAEVYVGIQAGDKQFLVLDLRNSSTTPTGHKKLDPATPGFAADYLLIDETFAPGSDSPTGFKGIRPDEAAYIGTGATSNGDRFEFQDGDGVEERHFAIYENRHGLLAVENFSDENVLVNVATIRRMSDETQTDPETIAIPASYEAGVAEDNEAHGQDRSLVDGFLFGVFDGVSSNERSGEAAAMIAQSLRTMTTQGESPHAYETAGAAEAHLRNRLQAASEAAGQMLRGNTTTGTVAEIVTVKQGNREIPHVVWASAGDSRLYRYSEADGLRLVTQDEGERNVITNSLGTSVSRDGMEHYVGVVRQTGHFAPQVDERMILVTDGVTGDVGSEVLTDQEISEAVKRHAFRTPHDDAEDLVDWSRKNDDKTAIIVEFLSQENKDRYQEHREFPYPPEDSDIIPYMEF
ncbi:MAG TPA: protein phosphatase 2C domain-containing protein [Candidatus Saccharimonadales bacterium]|jgi:serine/threonine protein phosphatase PrpC|nr:protein phosphatase 2C domain-containing protein [Candidatus Saccharimonadales bacterium]